MTNKYPSWWVTQTGVHPHYKYLCVEINAHNNVTETVQNLCSRSWEAIFKLNSIRPGTDIPARRKQSLLDKLVKPILLYNSEGGGSYWTNVSIFAKLVHANKISYLPFSRKASTLPFETVHSRFCKRAFGVQRKAINIAVMDELGRLPMSISVTKAMLKFWQHYADHIYSNATLRKATAAGRGPWFDSLKNIYDIFGWHRHGAAPTKKSIDTIIAVLTQSYKDHWYNSVHIQGGSKILIRKSINTQFNCWTIPTYHKMQLMRTRRC